MMTDNPEQDYQDHIKRQVPTDIYQDYDTEPIEILTPEQIDAHILKIKTNRL